MKKTLLLFTVVLMSLYSFGQMPLGWAITLPADYLTNKPERDTINVALVTDADITGANSLEEVWATVGSNYKLVIDKFHNKTIQDKTTGDTITIELPVPSATDFSAEMALMAGTDALYWLFNVKDDQPGNAEESKMEIIYASYPDGYDVSGRTIIPDKSGWWYDAANNSYQTFMAAGGDTLVIDDMARYGLWDETGAAKVELAVQTLAESYGGTMYFKSRGDTISGNPNFGTTTIPMTTIYETVTGGYMFLIIQPWSLIKNVKLAANGDMMSVSAKLKDYDTDNIQYTDIADGAVKRPTYEYWAGTENNNVFWAVAYYGLVAKVVVDNTSVNLIPKNATLYFANDYITLSGNRIADLEVYNITGKSVLKVKNPDKSINLGKLINGIYIARATDVKGQVATVKFVKE